MKAGIEVRRDISASVLRKKARREKDGRVASRMFGIANVLDGMDRDRAAVQAGMTRQTLRDWVHRYNNEGIEGLRNRPQGRVPRSLTSTQEQELADLVLKGPEGRLVRWRRIDLRDAIAEKYGVTYHERTVGKLLHRLGFSHISVRPMSPEADFAAQEDFKKTSPSRLPRSSPNMPAAKQSRYGSKMKRVSGKKVR
jgi:transposase